MNWTLAIVKLKLWGGGGPPKCQLPSISKKWVILKRFASLLYVYTVDCDMTAYGYIYKVIGCFFSQNLVEKKWKLIKGFPWGPLILIYILIDIFPRI